MLEIMIPVERSVASVYSRTLFIINSKYLSVRRETLLCYRGKLGFHMGIYVGFYVCIGK